MSIFSHISQTIILYLNELLLCFSSENWEQIGLAQVRGANSRLILGFRHLILSKNVNSIVSAKRKFIRHFLLRIYSCIRKYGKGKQNNSACGNVSVSQTPTSWLARINAELTGSLTFFKSKIENCLQILRYSL